MNFFCIHISAFLHTLQFTFEVYTYISVSVYLQSSTRLMNIWKSLGTVGCRPAIGSEDNLSTAPSEEVGSSVAAYIEERRLTI